MSGPRTHDKNDLVVITGAGGFIGGHLVSELVRQGHSRVRAVDIKPFDDWYQLVRGRVARYHNVYGPLGTFEGGREKAPAALCRKVIEALRSGSRDIEVWGDGEQTRSFMYIDDCLFGTVALTESDVREPLNIGSDELVTIDQLLDIVEDIAGVTLTRRYNLNAPKGVRGRSSDNTRVKQMLGWAPAIKLRDGMERTYRWIHDQLMVPAKARRGYS